jgi:hypothetical protein
MFGNIAVVPEFDKHSGSPRIAVSGKVEHIKKTFQNI